MKALEGDTAYNRVVVKHGGTDEDGASVTYTEELSQTDEYGILDWNCLGMAFREFVSQCHRRRHRGQSAGQRQGEMAVGWSEGRAGARRKGPGQAWLHPRLRPGRQRRGHPLLRQPGQMVPAFLRTRVDHPGDPDEEIPQSRSRLPYRRHLSSWRSGPGNRAVSSESLFDYNLNDLRVDESRNVDDYQCRNAATKAMAKASPEVLADWMRSFRGGTFYWEHQFGGYELKPQWGETAEEIAARKANWNKALELVGDSVVLAAKDGPVQTLTRKGYDPLEVPETVVRAAEEYGCATPSKILSADELDGRESFDPTPDAVAALDWVWERIVLAGMDDGKAKPPIRCFRKVMNGGAVVRGFLRDGMVYINEDLATGASVELRQTVLEEVAHYLTDSKDCTRDLQDWAFKLAVRVAMAIPDRPCPPEHTSES